MKWLVYALMTVVAWGLYGIFLHSGQVGMADKNNALYKSFLFVGLAYFLTAVLAPLAMLKANGATWVFPMQGMKWSLLAGIVGAVGAFCVLLAFANGGKPGVVMSIVFGGAPIINAIVAIGMNPPEDGWGAIPFQFYVGILLVAVGAVMVTYYKPAMARHAPVPVAAQSPITPAKAD
ncbi:MAG TPA: hypothetical protein VH413_05735 [Verrucomicrobiae bacterium]|jgi:hypothetical protein|nr:hypothetical protein [Verrucomicrobiae bacterium]